MKAPAVLLLITVLVAVSVCARADVPPKMRPYTGIGLLQLQDVNSEHAAHLFLYDEPGLSRKGSLEQDKLPGHSWIFNVPPSATPLIVTGRKGAWLRVVYDDAGREAWLNPPRSVVFQSWEHYFKNQVVRVLPGLQNKYLQLFQRPNRTVLTSLTPQQNFRVVRLEGDWAMVESGQSLSGWLRWRDEDSRLLIGVSTVSTVARQ